MINLLKANFYRLRKSMFFFITLIFVALFAIIMVSTSYVPNCFECQNQLGESFFAFNSLNIFFIAVATCFFIGTDYSDGAIRNKLVIGHSKKNIYLANLLTSVVIGFICAIVYMAVAGLYGLIIGEKIGVSVAQFFLILFDSAVLSIAVSSLFTFIAMIVANKSISLIVSIAFIVFSSMIGTTISLKLEQVGGLARRIYYFINNLLLTTQASDLSTAPIPDIYGEVALNTMWLYSLGIIIVITILGLIIFKKQDIK